MKKGIVKFSFLLIFVCLFSCKTKEDTTKILSKFKMAKVERNCTGVYLQMQEKYYMVCNVESLDSYEVGEHVRVIFEIIPESVCDMHTGRDMCEMAFPYHGMIHIISVK